ncbi:MAG: UDP-3-O-(3-hydroxymyristoyl)glucosamine N-acyltransferase [Pseudolabrys sp.]
MSETKFFECGPDLTIAEISKLTNAQPRNGADLSHRISNIAPVDQAGPDDLSFIESSKFIDALASTRAGALLTNERFEREAPPHLNILRVSNPYDAFVTVARAFFHSSLRPASMFGTRGVAQGAHVHPTARLADDVTVDPGAVIGPHAEIGAGTLIGANVIIGPNVRVGRECSIGSGSVVSHTLVGDRVIIYPNCNIGQDGFGYVSSVKGHIKVPQIGGVVIGNDVEIGAGTTVDRGSMRDTEIGEGTKIDNLCQIGHNVVIGRRCIIVAQSGLSGSAVLEDFVVLGARTGIKEHIRVGKGAMLASRSTVYEDVPAGAVWGGFPAKAKAQWMREIITLKRLAARPSNVTSPTISGDDTEL